MERRDLLRAFGAATALALLPHDAVAAWARVASGLRPTGGLTDAQLALVGAIADTILPRSDTPGATDVGVPAFVDVVVTENYGDAERSTFLTGLDAIDAQAKSSGGAAFVDLAPAARAAAIEAIESANDRRVEPNRTYWRLKGLIVHGYFTSESVMKKVLKVEIMPGKFDGAAPMPPKTGRAEGGQAHG
ncbi:MAG: gluconate 2-dehydrogenase subunit 3 family protein [Gemmatimonas sp.]